MGKKLCNIFSQKCLTNLLICDIMVNSVRAAPARTAQARKEGGLLPTLFIFLGLLPCEVSAIFQFQVQV